MVVRRWTLEAGPALYAYCPPFFVPLFTLDERATPDARERIYRATSAELIPAPQSCRQCPGSYLDLETESNGIDRACRRAF